MTENDTLTKVSLSATANVENDKLIVDYTVTNNLTTNIYVFDEMIRYDEQGKPKIDRDTAYVFWEEPSTLRVARALLNIPKEKDIYSLEIPYAREVKPKQSVSGKITLPLPVNEKSPFYALPGEENSKIVDCERLRLMIGWTEYRDGTTIKEADIAGDKVLRVRGSWQPFLVEKVLPVSTKVKAHTDVFDRQLPQKWKGQ